MAMTQDNEVEDWPLNQGLHHVVGWNWMEDPRSGTLPFQWAFAITLWYCLYGVPIPYLGSHNDSNVNVRFFYNCSPRADCFVM